LPPKQLNKDVEIDLFREGDEQMVSLWGITKGEENKTKTCKNNIKKHSFSSSS
jgi:hypothetical protein